MFNLFIFALICYGASNIMAFGSIFEFWRVYWKKYDPKFLGKLFECMMCISFWCGALFSYFIYSPVTASAMSTGYMAIFLDACLASGIVWLIHTVQECIERVATHTE